MRSGNAVSFLGRLLCHTNKNTFTPLQSFTHLVIVHCRLCARWANNFLTLFVSHDPICLLLIHHFFLIMSAYQFHHHHSHNPSLLHSFILASKHFFSINPSLHSTLVPPDWFHWLLDCSSAFLAQRFFLLFQFFPLQFLICFSFQLF